MFVNFVNFLEMGGLVVFLGLNFVIKFLRYDFLVDWLFLDVVFLGVVCKLFCFLLSVLLGVIIFCIKEFIFKLELNGVLL